MPRPDALLSRSRIALLLAMSLSMTVILASAGSQTASAGTLASAISVGAGHGCALTTGGGVKCWGSNTSGELGNGTMTGSSTPVNVSGLSTGVTAISAAWSYTCALTSGGGVKCWGLNTYGQLGNGTATNSSTPVDVSGLSAGVTAISAGQYHACALTSGGGVKCWGRNNRGELGDGTTTDSPTPVDVSGLSSGITQISSGSGFTCALTSGGGVKCWGRGSEGELGNGGAVLSPTPVDVSGLSSGVSAISSGGHHTCALMSTGGLECWGSNRNGELGRVTRGQDSYVPIRSGLTSGVSAVSSGYSHTCAVTTGGGAKCWGWNANGQLGNGTTNNSTSPVDVSGLTRGVAGVAGGFNDTCALTTPGAERCWGLNAGGKLGNGTTVSSTTQVQVAGLPGIPTIRRFTPGNGRSGTKVTITGLDFNYATRVSFHFKTASFRVVSNGSIVATVPPGATTGRIRVSTPGGVATSSGKFIVT